MLLLYKIWKFLQAQVARGACEFDAAPAPISNKTLFYLKLKMSRKECGNFTSNAHVRRYDICDDLACCHAVN